MSETIIETATPAPVIDLTIFEKERARLEFQAFTAPVCHVGTQKQLAALYAALAMAQGEFEVITKNRTGTIQYRDKKSGVVIGSYELRYADLEEITAKTRPALSRHGLATVQPVGPAKHGGGMALFTQLIHADGGMLISEISLPVNLNDGADIKTLGAVITFLRRYAKGSMLDVAADDDLDQSPEGFSQDHGGDREPEPRAGQVTRHPAESTSSEPRTSAAEYYSQEHFDKQLPGWIAAMRQGKSADYIIKVSTTKRKLTPEMIQTIHDNEPTQE